MKPSKLQRKINIFLNRNEIFLGFIAILIIMNVVAVLLESMERYRDYQDYFYLFELFSVWVFLCEYTLRIYSCTAMIKYRKPILGRIRYCFTPLAIIDFLAIFPFFLPAIVTDMRGLRVFRLARSIRIAKLGRYNRSLDTIIRVFKKQSDILLVAFIFILTLVLITSIFLYYAENEVQPEVFTSIPETMWQCVINLSFFGETDVEPVTLTGKIITTLIVIFGKAIWALPFGIIGAGFINEIKSKKCTCSESE